LEANAERKKLCNEIEDRLKRCHLIGCLLLARADEVME